MEHDIANEPQEELEREEADILDSNLQEIETLYRSRCIVVPNGKNVTVREIEDKK